MVRFPRLHDLGMVKNVKKYQWLVKLQMSGAKTMRCSGGNGLTGKKNMYYTSNIRNF